jgi:HEPN domain-containing protein
MRPHERAELLLRKAAQDEYVLQRLSPDPLCPDEPLGFHAQQAVEKMIKAVLASASLRYPFTHDLVDLIDMIRDHGLPFPEELEEVRVFAAELRYGDPEGIEQPLDRQWALNCTRRTRAWAESVVAEAPPDIHP